MKTLRPIYFLACIVWLAAGCASPSGTQPEPPEAPYWHGDGMTGAPSIRISLSRQRAYCYLGGQLAGVSTISSGREGRDTVTGKFHILEKDKDHASSLYGQYVDAQGKVLQSDVDTRTSDPPPGAHYSGADMPNWMRITGGTGMHAGYLPGYPASHGCIRMPAHMAAAFFRVVEVGTPVSIVP